MDIAKLLSKGQSRSTTQAIVDYIGGDPDRFAELMAVFNSGDFRTRQCSAWPISVVSEDHPELVEPYLAKLVALLPRKDNHSAVKRSTVRLMQFVEIPKRLHGKVFSFCIDLIDDPSEPIAVRCFAMTVAGRVAENEPALKNELKMVAEKSMEHATAGLKSRIRRLLSDR